MDISNLSLKYVWKDKRPRIANTILKKNKVRGLTLPNFKTYCKAIVIETVLLAKDKYPKQNRKLRNRPTQI